MKYKLLSAVLALASIELHSNFFGNKKPTAKFDEDQLQSIEDALAKNDTSALQNQITEHESTISGMQTEKTNTENAISDAFSMNKLELPEGASMAEAIAILGTKCQEYGSSNHTHSLTHTDGIDKDENEDESVNYAHNKAFDESKYTTLK